MGLLEGVERLAVIGSGLLGGSLGLGVKEAGYAGRVIGVARRQETLDAACKFGCIDEATTDLADAVRTSQLLVIATPLGAFERLLLEIGRHAHDELVITDVGSTKLSVLAAAKAGLSDGHYKRFVGAHPMAGSEKQGPEAARADLFAGKPCILTPEDDTDDEAVDRVVDLFETGLRMKLLQMTAREHDEKSAVISHLPHAAAVLLVKVAEQLGGLDIASTGFRDTTRLASSNPPMRTDILLANREQVVAALDTLAEHLAALREALTKADAETLTGVLDSAKQFRDTWTGHT